MTHTIQIYGASDDLLEVDGAISEEFGAVKLPDDDEGGLLAFSDGTVVRIVYSLAGVWRITPVRSGSGVLAIVQAPEADDDYYSDRATLTIVDPSTPSVVFGTQFAKGD